MNVTRRRRHPDLNFGKVFGPKDGIRHSTVTHRKSGKPLYRMAMNSARVWTFTFEGELLSIEVGTLGEVRDAVSWDWYRREWEALGYSTSRLPIGNARKAQ